MGGTIGGKREVPHRGGRPNWKRQRGKGFERRRIYSAMRRKGERRSKDSFLEGASIKTSKRDENLPVWRDLCLLKGRTSQNLLETKEEGGTLRSMPFAREKPTSWVSSRRGENRRPPKTRANEKHRAGKVGKRVAERSCEEASSQKKTGDGSRPEAEGRSEWSSGIEKSSEMKRGHLWRDP